jgi:hypothetical protein
MTWRGPYNAATTYAVNDVTSSAGSSYICISPTIGNQPPNATYWSLVAQIGATGATGATGPAGPTAVSADANNLAILGSDHLILVPASSIWSVRLRSFNALGNPNLEVDQRKCGTTTSYPTGAAGDFVMDRWIIGKSGTMTLTANQAVAGTDLVVPGTNFRISQNYLNIILTAQEATLAAGDYIQLGSYTEGPLLRELIGGVHSVSLLVKCSTALTFTLALASIASPFYTLTKLCQITTPNQWTLFSLPNLPVWTSGATWALTPGVLGYFLKIGLAGGSTYLSPANDTWQSGNFIVGPGSTNFASLPVNTTFQLGFIQHEPGALCTTPIDKSFTQNHDECLRYFQKSWDYSSAVGSATATGVIAFQLFNTTAALGVLRFFKPMADVPTMTSYALPMALRVDVSMLTPEASLAELVFSISIRRVVQA